MGTPKRIPVMSRRVLSACDQTSADAGYDVYAVQASLFDEAEHDDATAIAAVRGATFLGMYQSVAPADLADSD